MTEIVVLEQQKWHFRVSRFEISWGDAPRPQGPHPHILLTGGGGPSDFLGSEILAQSDFFGSLTGSLKDAGMFLGRRKYRGIFLGGCEKRTKGFFWVC